VPELRDAQYPRAPGAGEGRMLTQRDPFDELDALSRLRLEEVEYGVVP
jgi:hypothetical protein